jgi:hypothetical protein
MNECDKCLVLCGLDHFFCSSTSEPRGTWPIHVFEHLKNGIKFAEVKGFLIALLQNPLTT